MKWAVLIGSAWLLLSLPVGIAVGIVLRRRLHDLAVISHPSWR